MTPPQSTLPVAPPNTYSVRITLTVKFAAFCSKTLIVLQRANYTKRKIPFTRHVVPVVEITPNFHRN